MTRLIRFSGTAFTPDAVLDNGDELHVQVVNSSGAIVADAFGKVVAVTDRPRKDAEMVIERVYSVRVS